MPFRCVLTIASFRRRIAPPAREKETPVTQNTPFIFRTIEEAKQFGEVMFKPLQSVEAWEVEETKEPANYQFKTGKISPL